MQEITLSSFERLIREIVRSEIAVALAEVKASTAEQHLALREIGSSLRLLLQAMADGRDADGDHGKVVPMRPGRTPRSRTRSRLPVKGKKPDLRVVWDREKGGEQPPVSVRHFSPKPVALSESTDLDALWEAVLDDAEKVERQIVEASMPLDKEDGHDD